MDGSSRSPRNAVVPDEESARMKPEPNQTHDGMRLARREICEAFRFQSSPAASVSWSFGQIMRSRSIPLLAFIMSSVSVASDLPDPKGLSSDQQRQLFFLLGMNHESMGRRPGHPEHFYRNEVALAAVYTHRLAEFTKSAHLDGEDEAIQLIDGLYTKHGEYLDGSPVHFVSWDVFDGFGPEAVLGFIAGAYCRHWNGTSLRFANSTHKAQLLGSLLVGQECREIVVKIYPEYTPVGSEVVFTPAASMREMMQQIDAELKKFGGQVPN
jgi:hypothetical protein